MRFLRALWGDAPNEERPAVSGICVLLEQRRDNRVSMSGRIIHCNRASQSMEEAT
jgi:hypothetical protein